jgi:two-component system, NtrC family, sensor kinase
MNCPRCQQDNPAEQKFCGECGTPLQPVSHADPPAPSYAEVTSALSEALEQQTVAAEILRVISSSPTHLQPVFDIIAKRATALTDAVYSAVYLIEDGSIHLRAYYSNDVANTRQFAAAFPMPITSETLIAGTLRTGTLAHIADMEDVSVPETGRTLARTLGVRSTLAVPMRRDGHPIGAIGVNRREPGDFTPAEIALLQTFADQAVIAIENVRLFTELQTSNRELTTALETQTATSEILRVISQSPTDVQPVFDTIAENALRLCEATFSAVFRYDGELIHFAALRNATAEGAAAIRDKYPMPPGRGGAVARSILSRSIVHIADVLKDPEYAYRGVAAAAEFRSTLSVPMVRDGQPIGAITVAGPIARPFPEKQVELLRVFADQAVIAIENVRLFTELQQKNEALRAAHTQVTEALDQQTATSEILRVIASSQTDVQPVFDAIVTSATRLLRGYSGSLYRLAGDQIELVALTSTDAIGDTALKAAYPRSVDSDDLNAQAIRRRVPLNIAEAQTDPRLPEITHAYARARGFQSVGVVPMLRHDEAIGAIGVGRRDPGGFTDDEIALLKTFADQAVIAIENVRLFKELEAANRDLKAASQHKSEFLANMSHELRTPLNAIIGFSEVLGERMFGELNEKQDEYLKDIHASGQHLLSLINDILDLSKIEAGRMELELTDFHLPTALDNALTLVRERAGRRGIALHMAADERLDYVRADERKVRQVVLNLLSNAIKFTLDGGRIEVRAKPVNGSVEVAVTDTGVGIAPEDQEAIFEEFRQVGTAAKKVEGTGLGLTLSRKFIELHGGKIWVESQLGTGSTFTFAIPLRCAE